MDLTNYKDYTVDDFVNEETFWLWVLENNEEQKNFWQQFLQKYPEKEETVEQAKRLVLEMNTVTNVLTEAKVNALWSSISEASFKPGLYQTNESAAN